MKLKFLSIAMWMLISSFVIAQTNEGSIKYKIEMDGSMDPQIAAMLKDANLSISYKNDKIRTDMDMVMSKTSTIKSDGKTTTLVDMMGKKYKVNMTDDMIKSKKSNENDYDIVYTDETKNICGYECKKAIIKMKNGSTTDLYYTDKLNSIGSDFQQYSKFKGGCPMQFVMSERGMNMTLTATEVNTKPIADSLFVIPDGYEEMSLDMVKQMYGMGDKKK